MRNAIFHSIPEALTYFLLILVIILNIVGLAVSLTTQRQIAHSTKEVENQQSCIFNYFTTPGRTGNTVINPINCAIEK